MVSFLENSYPSTKTWMTVVSVLLGGGSGRKWTECPWSKTCPASRLLILSAFMPQRSRNLPGWVTGAAAQSQAEPAFSHLGASWWRTQQPGASAGEQPPHTEQGRSTFVFIVDSIIFSLVVMGHITLKAVLILQNLGISALRGPDFGSSQTGCSSPPLSYLSWVTVTRLLLSTPHTL